MLKPGIAFGDSIHTEKISRRKKNNTGQHTTRDYLLLISIGIVLVILLGRTFLLQVAQGAYYRTLSNSNKTRTEVIHAPRGIIFDRNGKPLVYNMPGFRETINGKTHILDTQEALSKIAQGDTHVEVDNLRQYPYKDAMAHIVGYIGQISSDELLSPEYTDYQSGDLIGKSGIEQEEEKKLRGTDGQKLLEVDATGKTVRILGQTDPISGGNVTLTIDANLQQDAFSAMKDVKKGAAIVTSPNGAVLAMVSKPSFDPNLFTLGDNYKPDATSTYSNVAQIVTDGANQPLLNRAIAGTYPPGSTFKLMTSAAGLESHKIDENYTVDDEGMLRVGSFSFANWYFTDYGKTEGVINIVTAIKRSNDIFFYKLGELLGVDTISSKAKKFGVGSPLGIDLQGEAAGLLPTKEWKEKVIGDKWYLGDDYHYAIGQGYLLVTPLQVNALTQAIANGGMLYQPHIINDQKPKVLSQNLLDAKNFGLIRQGMIEACQTGGVAWPFFNFTVKNAHLKIDGQDFTQPEASLSADPTAREVTVACKTGTAQQDSGNGNPHAWITLFAPAYHPQVVITVLAEDSGEGSNIAGPIAKQILTDWFEKQ